MVGALLCQIYSFYHKPVPKQYKHSYELSMSDLPVKNTVKNVIMILTCKSVPLLTVANFTQLLGESDVKSTNKVVPRPLAAKQGKYCCLAIKYHATKSFFNNTLLHSDIIGKGCTKKTTPYAIINMYYRVRILSEKHDCF